MSTVNGDKKDKPAPESSEFFMVPFTFILLSEGKRSVGRKISMYYVLFVWVGASATTSKIIILQMTYVRQTMRVWGLGWLIVSHVA